MITKLGILCSRIRLEENLLIKEAIKRKDVELELLDPRRIVFDPDSSFDLDVLLDREISHSRSYHVIELLQNSPIKIINNFDTVKICGDKAFTSCILQKHQVPIPRFKVAFDRRSALKAAEQLGYPLVLKPVDGSWGRLMAKINDPNAAEAVFEHKSYLPSYFHSIYYLQEYIEKKNRDMRAFVIGDEVIGAAYRVSDHWITNADRGGKAKPCSITNEMEEICKKAAEAVGGEALAVDLLETKHGLLVNEINYSMEFKESMKVIQTNIPAKLIDYLT